MDGILLINKPIGITSRDVVNQLTKKFNIDDVDIQNESLEDIIRGIYEED